MRIEIRKKRIYGNGVRRPEWGSAHADPKPISMFNYRVVVDGKLVDSFLYRRNAVAKVRLLQAEENMKSTKIDKTKARYVDSSPNNQHCAGCVMFLSSKSKCTLVKGKINRDGWCRYWETPK